MESAIKMQQKRLYLDNLAIEVTRRCNLQCEHCLRGAAESVDFHVADLQDFLSAVYRDYYNVEIDTITLTGGEPLLAVDTLRKIREELQAWGIRPRSFYLATNATRVTEAAIIELLQWWLFVEDSEYGYNKNECLSAVHWSNDPYHAEEADQTDGIRRLSALAFAGPKYVNSDDYLPPISEGRAASFGRGKPREEAVELEEDDDEDRLYAVVYLNCRSQVVLGCDWSYDNQSTHAIADVREFEMEMIR